MSIPVFAPGKSLTSGGTSVSGQIPADSAGCLPLFVRVTSTAAGYFRISNDASTAVVGDALIQPSDSLILKTCGLSWFSFVSHSGSSTVTVTPIDVGGIAYPSGFNPLSFFVNNEQGAWYDPSDLTTLFQDAAGTIPVTAVEQPVGLMKDKSGRGNHAFQTTSANRPVLSARVNLLTKTEDFSDAAWWTTSGVTASKNTITCVNGGCAVYTQFGNSTLLAGTYTLSCAVLKGKSFNLTIDDAAGNGIGVYFNGTNGVGTTVILGSGWSVTNSSCVTHPNDSNYWLASVTIVRPTTTAYSNVAIRPNINDSATYAGSCTAGQTLVLWGADLRVTNTGVNLPPYQRVNTSTDYDTAGFPLYLKCNGTNTAMQTNSIDFTGTDKMTVWAGVRKLSDATSIIAEISVVGSDFMAALLSSQYESRVGSWGGTGYPGTYGNAGGVISAPLTTIQAVSYSANGNIASDFISCRVNAVSKTYTPDIINSSTGKKFSNSPLYLFVRSGTSLFFNGNFYGLIVRGAQSTAAQISSAESYIAKKTGLYGDYNYLSSSAGDQLVTSSGNSLITGQTYQ